MAEDIIAQYLSSCISSSDPRQQRVAVFERVRDLPYHFPASRDPAEVIAQGRGSCSGKHYLLGELFRRIGVPVRHMICTQRFNESPLAFPDAMQATLRKNEIVDLHDFLRIRVDGKWIDIDATWPSNLREFGFPVNDEWDGCRPMGLSVVPDEISMTETDPERLKEELLSKLTQRQRTQRKDFLLALSAWVNELAAETQRDVDRS